jgi:hypothetical protein
MAKSLLFLPILIIIMAPGLAQDPPDAPPAKDPGKEITPRMAQAIEKGLYWLSRNQNRKGSYGNGSAPVATTALAGLAFLAGGHTPGRSKYGDNVKKCVQYLMRHTSREGYINEGSGTQRGAGGSGMHGHGYAMLFLSQVYGMADNLSSSEIEDLKVKLTRAARVSEQSQTKDGGWNYEPSQNYDEGSVTITQVQALRAVRNAGIRVNLTTINKAIEYVNKVTSANGQTRYSLRSGGGGTRATLTGAAMCAMTYLGEYDNPKILKGLKFLLDGYLPGKGPNTAASGAWGQWWFFYGNYYATIAMYQAGGNYWSRWWPAVREQLIKAQGSNGAWTRGESQNYGTAFGTALALITLQVPYRYLPIFQRAQD